METSKTVPKTNKMAKDNKTKPVAQAPTTTTTTTTPAKAGRKASAKAEVVVPVTTTQPVATPTETRNTDAILSNLQETLKTLGSEFSSKIREAVKEAVEASKALKREARDSKKRRRKDPKDMTPEEKKAYEARRANNAFLKLRPLSDELSTFMGLPSKSQRSQTDVTKYIANYVKTHNCFDPNFKRRIIPDAKLTKLLKVKDGQDVTYLNLQSFLKVHFLKPTA